MTVAYQDLLAHLDNHELKYVRDEEEGAVFFPVATETATVNVKATVSAELFQVWGWAPIKVPAGCRRDVAEAIARANYGLKVGKFEMDFSDGELRFQVYVILQGEGLPDDLAHRMFRTVLNMLDRYMPSLMAIVFANEEPADAIRRVEFPAFPQLPGPTDEGDAQESGSDD